MLQVTRGAQFSLVTVRVSAPDSAAGEAAFPCDVEVEFAGRTAHYRDVVFEETRKGAEIRVTGTVPATLADFQMEPPSLLSIPVKNEIPVKVEMTWRGQ